MLLIKHGQVLKWNSETRDFISSDVGPLVLLLPVDIVNGSNVLTGLLDLSCPVISAKMYNFEIVLWVSDNNGEGLKIDLLGGTAGMTWFHGTYRGYDETLSLVKQVSSMSMVLDSDGFSGMIEIKGSFSPSSDGTFTVRTAQKAHVSGSLIVLKGSSLLLREAAA